ncbi:MAG: S8 family peptidase [Saprospiraceae bacterium]|uniref:S8 family peptidase n=1 Tax=Candidatus Opimibacter skivensis TaxID=2982028 RepID=A0A9D7XU50_9BACT|nr:S8 family peptidase [Candidatus Opimibacter skivensis]
MILILLYTSLISFFQVIPMSEPTSRWLVEMNTASTVCLDQWWIDRGYNSTSYLKKKLPVDTWLVVELPESAVSALQKLPCVDRVMEDQRINWRNTVPNDPAYINQGDMNLIGMPKAWDITTGGVTKSGDTIVVAVVDDGFDIQHQDLVPNIWLNKGEIPNDGIDNDGNGYTDDYKGLNVKTGKDDHPKKQHGTQVSGVVGAKGNNSVGVTGVNWNVKLMLISGADFESEVIEAYQYAIDMRKKYKETNGQEGAFVVATNLSGGIDNAFAADHPLWCEMYDKMGAVGILSVTAGPNNSISVDVDGDMPTTCTSPYMIAVTNVDLSDVIMENAGFGSVSIDIGAPGEGTLTVDLNNQYHGFSGTSASAPHVAGSIALLYSVPCTTLLDGIDIHPDEVALKMKDFIFSSAKNNNSLQGITVTGKRIQTDAAIKAALAQCSTSVEPVLRIISIFPNPASLEKVKVHVLVRGDSTNVACDVYATNGALVRSFPVTSDEINQGYFLLDTKPLAAALYMVTLRRNKEKDTFKLFVY